MKNDSGLMHFQL